MNRLPGEPAYEGLAKKEVKDELRDEYEELVAKKACEVCRPDCKHKECPDDSIACPCFKAMPFDLWLEETKDRRLAL